MNMKTMQKDELTGPDAIPHSCMYTCIKKATFLAWRLRDHYGLLLILEIWEQRQFLEND